jgi:hypothetical protein
MTCLWITAKSCDCLRVVVLELEGASDTRQGKTSAANLVGRTTDLRVYIPPAKQDFLQVRTMRGWTSMIVFAEDIATRHWQRSRREP